MAHFAHIKNGIVDSVIAADQEFIDSLNDASEWIRTSYGVRGGVHYDPSTNMPDGVTALRANFAGIGYIYDAENDVFYPPQPFPSWTICAPNWTWLAPIPMPQDGKAYQWNESTKSWDLFGQMI